MGTVIISAHFDSGENTFADAAESMLRGMGATVSRTVGIDGIAVFSCRKDVAVTPSEPDHNTPVEQSSCEPESPTELVVNITDSDVVTLTEPVAEPQPDTCNIECQAILKNLSSMCAVQAKIDSTYNISLLSVKKLQVCDDYAIFSYCDMSFRLPIEKTIVNVCNINPIIYPGIPSIRCMVQIVGSESDLVPVLFQLIDTDGECCAIFGNDTSAVILRLADKLYDTISAQ